MMRFRLCSLWKVQRYALSLALSSAFSPSVLSADLAVGYGELDYTPPAIGSYQLPSLGLAADGQVLDEQGQAQSLQQILTGKYTLLSFIYSNCSDVNGCPLAAHVFYKLKTLMQEQPELAEKLQLVSLSFDPERDTPEIMRLYGDNFKYAGQQGTWRFLTTASPTELKPILQAYQQEVQREISVNGQSADYAHMLRVFLIDPDLQIRQIYSVGFLHPMLILNDLQTLWLTKQAQNTALTDKSPKQAIDLIELAQQPPLGLPPLSEEILKQLNKDKVLLGQKLFFDRRLSLNNTFSCAMCHIPEQGFTSNEMATAVGVEGRTVRRNAPSLFNVAYSKRLFHDGRDTQLDEQVWSPLLAHNEMANPSVGYVLDKLRGLPDYQGRFESVYTSKPTMLNLGDALAAYERTLLSADSPFDRWQFGKQAEALSTEAQQGFRLFTGKAGCVACHHIAEKSALFTDEQLHNTGLGYRESLGLRSAKQRVEIAKGVFVEVDRHIIDQVSEKPPQDLGLYEITQNPADRWKYKTPSLRNVALTAPYMHNGSLTSLAEVVSFYNQGGIPNPNLSPLIKPLHLSTEEQTYLVAFLQSLTGSNVASLVANAALTPIGDPTRQDPNWANQLSTPLQGEVR